MTETSDTLTLAGSRVVRRTLTMPRRARSDGQASPRAAQRSSRAAKGHAILQAGPSARAKGRTGRLTVQHKESA